jgi:hypothetical protein
MTEGFWLSQANGAFLPEYPLVRRGKDCGWRAVDGIILPDEPHRAQFKEYPSLDGRIVIVVQTKRGRMGMYLMGQALFSARLAQRAGAASVRSVLLCHEPDTVLLPLLEPFSEVEVWLSDRLDPLSCRRATS